MGSRFCPRQATPVYAKGVYPTPTWQAHCRLYDSMSMRGWKSRLLIASVRRRRECFQIVVERRTDLRPRPLVHRFVAGQSFRPQRPVGWVRRLPPSRDSCKRRSACTTTPPGPNFPKEAAHNWVEYFLASLVQRAWSWTLSGGDAGRVCHFSFGSGIREMHEKALVFCTKAPCFCLLALLDFTLRGDQVFAPSGIDLGEPGAFLRKKARCGRHGSFPLRWQTLARSRHFSDRWWSRARSAEGSRCNRRSDSFEFR
jgi:hypothetical protein